MLSFSPAVRRIGSELCKEYSRIIQTFLHSGSPAKQAEVSALPSLSRGQSRVVSSLRCHADETLASVPGSAQPGMSSHGRVEYTQPHALCCLSP
eukprot:3073152-Rhodomonas_salina.2